MRRSSACLLWTRRRWVPFAIGSASVTWLLLRSEPDSGRCAHSSQRPATTGRLHRLVRQSTSQRRLSAAILALLLLGGLTGSSVHPPIARRTASPQLPWWISPSAISSVYAVADVPVPPCSLGGGCLPDSGPCSDPAFALRDAGVDLLLAEMSSRREHLLRTEANPDGLIRADAVVVIEVDNRWGGRGRGAGRGRLSTNTDALKGLIWRIVQHPDGFIGEVVVAGSGQESGATVDTTPANAEDQEQSLEDVVQTFSRLGYPVSWSSWEPLSWDLVQGGSVNDPGYPAGEYARGDMDDAYVLLDDPGGGGEDELSYPKFRTALGHRVSMRYGVWTGVDYDSGRLVFVNMPVLKAHRGAGATIAWGNLVGFITARDAGRRFGGPDQVQEYCWGATGSGGSGYGLLGRQLALIRAPDLNLVDAIWVADDSSDGIAYRQDVLLASRDPFAVDWYASEVVLYPLVGYTQDVSAARAGTFRNATRTNQDSAAAVWPGGEYPWIDLLDSYDGDTPTVEERDQMSVFVAGAPFFADDFESEDTSAWSNVVP